MGSTRRLPPDTYQQLDKLQRDNWRTQVSTGTTQGEPVVVQPVTVPPDQNLSDVLERLEVIEQRLNNLEGVDESG